VRSTKELRLHEAPVSKLEINVIMISLDCFSLTCKVMETLLSTGELEHSCYWYEFFMEELLREML
jgi:hypothetical protein